MFLTNLDDKVIDKALKNVSDLSQRKNHRIEAYRKVKSNSANIRIGLTQSVDTAGVDFTNILRPAFTCTGPKSTK